MRRIETAPPAAAAGARALRAVGVSGRFVIAIVLGLACRAADAGSASASLTVTAIVQSAWYKVALSPAGTPGAGISQILLSNGSESPQYNLYTTSDLVTVIITY